MAARLVQIVMVSSMAHMGMGKANLMECPYEQWLRIYGIAYPQPLNGCRQLLVFRFESAF